jgi:ribosomal protein S18 acetylase RimI-like enzyme
VTLTLLEGHDATVADFVAGLAPIERPLFVAGHDRAFGILRDGVLIGGVLFTEWKPAFRTLELSGAAVSSPCANTQIVRRIGDYAFGQLNAYRLFARTGASNERAKRLLRILGFTQEAVQGHYYGEGKHASCWRLIKPEWERKWHPKRMQQAA